MSYRTTERTFYARSSQLRERLFAPLLKFLAHYRITANHITFIRMALFVALVVYPLFVRGALVFATVMYFAVFWLLDTLDGQLARYTNTSSDKGKFNDVFVDQLGYAIYIMGLAFAGVSDLFILFYHVIISGAVYVLAIVQKNETQPSDWLVRPEPNLSYFKLIAHLAIIILLLFGINLVDLTFGFLNIWMTLAAVIYFYRLQHQTFKS